MTAIVLLIACAVLGQAVAVVELNCSDNATCIDFMAKEFVRSMRQQRPVRVFDVLTIEPVARTRQARASQGWLSKFLESHAFSFDWNDWSFRLTKPEDRSGVIDVEVYESRTAKDVPSEQIPKKSNSKVEEEEDKTSKRRTGLKRRQKKKVLQAVIPLMFGMKSAGAVIFSMAMVTVLTLKAFVASKLALAVTAGMALKRLYETYGQGVGLQNHPYLYSQYPIDFPSASSHQYAVSGMNPQYGSQELYNPALATHQHELLQQNDASAQQSQQAPTLFNSTRATERWDGKSKLLQFIEPLIDGFKSFVDPIASVFYSAMPATFRGLNSDVSTQKRIDEVKKEVKKPREILLPQPRHIAQRKMTYKKALRPRPKKYNELKFDLDKLKQNKDLHDYVKTKKYKYNYPNTYYYPRVKYFVNPHSFNFKINNSRLTPYRKEFLQYNSVSNNITPIVNTSSEWQPIVVPNLDIAVPNNINPISENSQLVPLKRKRTRVKREINEMYTKSFQNVMLGNIEGRRYSAGRGFFDLLNTMFESDPVSAMFKEADKYAESYIHQSLKSKAPPKYYSVAYDAIMFALEVIDGFVSVQDAVKNHIVHDKNKKKRKTKKRQKQTHDTHDDQSKVSSQICKKKL